MTVQLLSYGNKTNQPLLNCCSLNLVIRNQSADQYLRFLVPLLTDAKLLLELLLQPHPIPEMTQTPS